MDISTILLILGGIGVSLFAAGAIAKYTGLGEVVNIITNFFHTVINGVGRVVSFAPRGLQILIFVFVGVGAMSWIVSFYAGSTMVCSNCVPYEATFSEALAANMYSSSAWCSEGSPDPDFVNEQKGVVTAKSELLGFPATIYGMTGVGTLMGTKSDIGSAAYNSGFLEGDTLIAVPKGDASSFDASNVVYNICQRSDNSCFLDKNTFFRPYCGFGATKIYSVGYYFFDVPESEALAVQVTMGQVLTDVQFSGNKFDASSLNTCSTPGGLPLELSGYAFAEGEAAKYKYAIENTKTYPIDPIGRGTVEMEYVSLSAFLRGRSDGDTALAGADHGFATEILDSSEGSSSARQKFVENAKLEIHQSSWNNPMGYVCEGKDEVGVRLLGVDIFNIKTLAVLFVIGFLFWLLKFVGMF